MGGSDALNPVIDTQRLVSGRWIRYLLLGIFGSAIGGVIITLIATLWTFFYVGPFALMTTLIPGLIISALILPLWAIVAAVVGLRLAKGHAISTMGVVVERDTPLAQRVARIAAKAGLPVPPEVGVYESDEVNAFATGSSRANSLVAFSSTLMETATEDEIEAVAAHEVGHIANGDMVALCVVNSIQNAMSWYMVFHSLRGLVRWLIFFVTEIGATALSRRREYRADAFAAALIGPDDLIRFLRRFCLDDAETRSIPVIASDSYAMQKFMDTSTWTHPVPQKRIAALESKRYAHTVPMRGASADTGDFFLG